MRSDDDKKVEVAGRPSEAKAERVNVGDGLEPKGGVENRWLGKNVEQMLEESLKQSPAEVAYRSLPLEERMTLIKKKFWSLQNGGKADEDDVSDLCVAYWEDFIDEATFAAVACFGMEESFFSFVDANVTADE